MYYKVPLRIQIFNDAVPLQVNYETMGINVSKTRPNSVISMLHHYLAVHSIKEPHLHLHADNCAGQNKNKSVLAYRMWRTLVGLNDKVILSIVRVGHTQCFVDACFGLLEK